MKEAEKDKVFEEHNKKTMFLIKISIIASVIGTLIAVFFVMPKEYIDYNFLLIIGELFKNIMIVSILIEIIYFFVHKTELGPIYKKFSEERKNSNYYKDENFKIKPYDDMSPCDGVNNPSSPACHHPNSFNERFRYRE